MPRTDSRCRPPIRVPSIAAWLSPATVPEGKRVPFGWLPTEIGTHPIVIEFGRPIYQASAFRVTNALDVRTRAALEIRSVSSGAPIGTIDFSYAVATQVGEIELSAEQARDASRSGIAARTTGPEPLLLVARAPVTHVPHLLIPGSCSPQARVIDALASPTGTLTQFGWMAGCVLDALLDLGLEDALDRQIDYYFDESGPVWEDFRSKPRDGEVSGTETTSMYAALSQRRPSHPAVRLAVDFFESRRSVHGCVTDGRFAAEHNYTVAQTLAAIGSALHDARLLEMAIAELRRRRDTLRYNGSIWLRQRSDGTRTYRSWARGVTWYLLGAVRSLRYLGDYPGIDDLREDVTEGCCWAAGFQRDDGLWPVFLEEADSPAETSGSAGIATACALAGSLGLIDVGVTQQITHRALGGLMPYVTADGLVGGMSQSNKAEAGEDLQRSHFRVIGACATGLVGQLLAAADAIGFNHSSSRRNPESEEGAT